VGDRESARPNGAKASVVESLEHAASTLIPISDNKSEPRTKRMNYLQRSPENTRSWRPTYTAPHETAISRDLRWRFPSDYL
jgi:hypothetical protein